jgi:hypothetical protein
LRAVGLYPIFINPHFSTPACQRIADLDDVKKERERSIKMQSPDFLFGRTAETQQVMCMILYSEFAAEAVHATLESVGVAGFTELSKVTGRGPRGQHFDTHVWPGYEGMIYCVLDTEQSETLIRALTTLNSSIEQNSGGSRGLHVFTWLCQQRL